MAYWEFLLQKEGDRDWLPLETAHVEISEGRYRIIAHTSYCQTAVNIYLSQLLTDPMPPRRKTLKRSDHTTENGLMVVIPFTHLTAGSWTVECTAAAAAAATDSSWQYGVQLQVLALETGLDYWDADLEEPISDIQIPSDRLSSTTNLELPTLPRSPQVGVSEASEAPGRERSPRSDAPSSLNDEDDFRKLDTASIEDLPLRLQLQHQAMVAQQAGALSLQGQVTTFSQVDGLPSAGTLWIQLRNPETGKIVHRESSPIDLTIIPTRFDHPISLPDPLNCRLLVGEMSLWSTATPSQVLGIQGFTVTLNLDALLEAVANRAEQLEAVTFEDLTAAPLDMMATESSRSRHDAADRSREGDREDQLSHREIPFRRLYLPATGLTLPPVIYSPVDSKVMGEPRLPLLAGEAAPNQAAAAPADRPLKSLSLPPIGNTVKSTQVSRQAAQADAASVERSPIDSAAADRTADDPSTSDDEAIAPQETSQEPSQESAASSSGPDFQGRFWSRLTALAHEAQKAAADLKMQMEAAGVALPSETSASDITLATPNLTTDAPGYRHEVVVYDSDSPTDWLSDAATTGLEADLDPSEPQQPRPSNDITEELGAIPVPQLVIPEGTLVAGTSLPITVQLPADPRRLAVKVWVIDVQSRSLADRPRWLMSWMPTVDGNQTAMLQLQVPLGSLEAQFEAIAIDLTVQQESYKATVVRSIIPPNLSAANAADTI